MNEFENFFNFSTDPMTIADANGKIIHVNTVYTAITGWAVDELKTKSYWDLIYPDDHTKARAAIQTLKAGHPVFALEYRFLCKDGSYKTFIANITGNKNSGYLYAFKQVERGTNYSVYHCCKHGSSGCHYR